MARVPVARVALSLRARSERLAWRSARSPFGRFLPRCTAARSRCDSVERVIGRATHHPPSAPPRPAPGRWANRWAKSASIRRSTERSPGASGSSFCLQASHFKPFPGAASDHFTRERTEVRNLPRPWLNQATRALRRTKRAVGIATRRTLPERHDSSSEAAVYRLSAPSRRRQVWPPEKQIVRAGD